MSQSEPQLIFSQQSSDEKVQVWQQDDRRWLDFDDELIQSEIVLTDPDTLPLALNRAMLAGMMFVEQPKRVLLAGTGGGATARYFASRFPDVEGCAVEKSAIVMAVARDYFDFPASQNWQLISDDIVEYVQQCELKYDLIVIDIAVDLKTPQWIVDQQFLQHCRSLLKEDGHVAFNLLVEDASALLNYLAAIRIVFDYRTVCLSLPNHRNIVTFAFNQSPPFLPDDIEMRLAELEASWGLEYTDFYQQMLIDNPQQSGVF